MNRFSSALLLAAPFAVIAPYAVAAQHPAQTQMQQNIDTVLKIARNTSLSEAQKIKQIESYANRYLDYERISAMAVGAPWRNFSVKQKTDFIAAFKDMVVSMYARSALIGAADAKVRLLPNKMTANGKRLDVFSELQTKNGKKYEVAYQLYPAGSIYKIYNFRVDGASLVTIYRNQFNELIKQKGIDGAIAAVKAKSLKKQ
ncbi:MlaC/ttg2D family ABC transporter substrate-binding protein [Neisseria animalis]|uniref:ABC transporter substrate-binding protein n=1 Tax=Neisseria animalis TaxID=492 RepID=A0A5P3MST0_NEIAN|nr:ABC transporter substrate-binding protein [Neisseria animalis]QEY24667.1 ABC transporter substrate-binding protein [Neisseria animalis]ROW31467.1 ABC transporter substrate-binding protein [Neisseria animalis]VEE07595.1 periplasmic transport protein [Neisseria animalis]